MVITLDMKDAKLLAFLEQDGRASFSEIGRNIGVSKEVANYRFRGLAERGIVTGFRAVTNYYALGFQCYRLIINLQNLKYHVRERFINHVRTFPRVEVVVYLLSDWDVEILVWSKSPHEFSLFYESLIHRFAEYIAGRHFSLVTSIREYSSAFLHNNRAETILQSSEKIITLEHTSMIILEELQKYPIENVVTISSRIEKKEKVTPAIVSYALRNFLKQGIIKRIVPRLNTTLLGYNMFVVTITLKSHLERRKIMEELSKNNHVTRILELLGEEDISFDVEYQTSGELDEYLESLRRNVPSIKDFRVVNVVKG